MQKYKPSELAAEAKYLNQCYEDSGIEKLEEFYLQQKGVMKLKDGMRVVTDAGNYQKYQAIFSTWKAKKLAVKK
jgi:hypothetical protein